jgi:hypothetical protein
MEHSVLSPEVFAHSPRPPMNFFIDYGSSHRVSLPFNVSPDVPTQPSKEVQVALLRFLPLRRISSSRAHSPRACLTRYVAPSGFLNLLTLSFSRSRPALFHAGNALGVTPSRAFPLSLAALPTHRRRFYPHAVSQKSSRKNSLDSTPGPCAKNRSVAPLRHISAYTKPDALLGFSPLQGSPLLLRFQLGPFGCRPSILL